MSREVKYTLTVDSKTGKANLGNFERQAASTTKTLQNQTKTVNAGEKAFSSFGKVIAAVGGAAALFSLASMTKQFVGLAMAQQDAEIAMSSALKVTGEYTDEINKKFQDFASSIQAATTYGDEEVLKLMALQKNLGVTTNRLEAAAQMSIGLAAATGRNAESMAMYVALAEQGEYTMLNRYIPALRAAKTETEKLKVLTDFTARGFEVAKSQTETFSGAIKQTSNTFGDLKEKIGDFVVKNAVAVEAVKVADDLFRDWQEDIKLTADHFNTWALANKELIKADVKGFLIGIKDALKGIVDVYQMLPDGVIGAAGTGIIARILTGSTPIGQAAAALMLINTQIEKMGLNLYKVRAEAEMVAEAESMIAERSGLFGGGSSGGISGAGAGWGETEEEGEAATGQGGAAAVEEEAAIAEEKKVLWQATTDFWAIQAQDRYDISRRVIENEIDLENRAATAKKSIQGDVANNTIKLMMALGMQNETFTAIGIAISTAAEMVRAYQAAVSASTLAFASQLIPGDPTSFARATAAAATAMSWGLANVALIGAAGMMSGISAMSGSSGGSVGSVGSISTISDATSDLTTDLSTSTEEKTGTLNIYLEGDVLADEYYIELLAEKISDAVEDRDVKLIATYSNTAGSVA